MKLVYTKSLKEDVQRLPVNIQSRLKTLIFLLERDFYHPYLHTKPLKEKWLGCFSFRITRGYRCIFQVRDDQIILLTVDHRKDVYR